MKSDDLFKSLDFNKGNGLIPVIVQEADTKEMLMLAYANEEALRKTLSTGYAHYWSRSRNKLWLKGETSGHRLVVKDIFTDCDQDALLVRVEPLGPGVCHDGYQSCFYRRLKDREWVVTEDRAYDPGQVYGSTK